MHGDSVLTGVGVLPGMAHRWYIPLLLTTENNAKALSSNIPPRAFCTHGEMLPLHAA